MAAKKRKRKWNVQVGDATLDEGETVDMPRAWRFDESGGPAGESAEMRAADTFFPTDLAGGGVGMGYGPVHPVGDPELPGFDSVLLPDGEIAYVRKKAADKPGEMGRTVPFSNAPQPPWDVRVGDATLEPSVSVEIGEPEFFQDGVRAVLGEPVITSEAPAPKRKPKKPVRK
jgi:hypothetical protein